MTVFFISAMILKKENELNTIIIQVCVLLNFVKFVICYTMGDLINRSDLVLRPNFGLSPNLHKCFK